MPHSDAGARQCCGRSNRLNQIVVNLVGNAVKFTSVGDIVVKVEIESQSEGQGVLHFSVVDTGPGIPADKQKLIFEAFTQSDNSTTRKYGGTGLGLSISSKLVGLLGGRIWVESQPATAAPSISPCHAACTNDPTTS